MSSITRHALRVYAALGALKGSGEDVLDALIPFFDPILQLMDKKIFDPKLLAAGLQKMYHWRITKEIAEQFIPRLVKRGYLQKVGVGNDATYGVTFPTNKETFEADDIKIVFEKLIDEFAAFPSVVNDLLQYTKTREELADILIRFLVSSNSFANENGKFSPIKNEDSGPLAGLEEGGRALTVDDRYLAARFVQYIADKHPENMQHLSRLASIGLLTEVVDDFVRPVTATIQADLTIVLDAPLALDYLGLSGRSTQQDLRAIFDELKKIGCKLIVFPVTCGEMTGNLNGMLALTGHRRHGPTHDAMIKGEVLEEFVKVVAARPEDALEKAGIQVRKIDLTQFPNSHKYFDDAVYEDFFAAIHWVVDVAPREHDATCMALLMRLREGKHSYDIFKCRYVFVTRNPTFARVSRKYCLNSQMIRENQEGPVVHQRELATIAWLRTGLSSAEAIPRTTLVATCDRMLRVRPEVIDAIRTKIREFAAEKAEQFELLLLDYRSVRKIGDATLNDENVVTGENAPQLLELMRKATKEEVEKEYGEKLAVTKQSHLETQRKSRDKFHAAITEKEQQLGDISSKLSALQTAEEKNSEKTKGIVNHMIGTINTRTRRVRGAVTFVLIVIGIAGVLNMLFEFYTTASIWNWFLTIIGIIGLYHLIMDVLQKPKWGLRNALNSLARYFLRREVRRRGISWVSESDFDLVDGIVSEKNLIK